MPRTLTHDGQGHILQNPAAELDVLRGAPVAVKDGAVQAVSTCLDLQSRPPRGLRTDAERRADAGLHRG